MDISDFRTVIALTETGGVTATAKLPFRVARARRVAFPRPLIPPDQQHHSRDVSPVYYRPVSAPGNMRMTGADGAGLNAFRRNQICWMNARILSQEFGNRGENLLRGVP